MDIFALIGVVIAFAAIIGGNLLEGGQMAALLDTPAGVIVLGGTLGAVILQTPLVRLKRAANLLRWVIWPAQRDMSRSIRSLCDWSRLSRKEGLLGLENLLESQQDPFTRKGLALLVDGSEPHNIRRVLEMDLEARTDSDLAAARVF